MIPPDLEAVSAIENASFSSPWSAGSIIDAIGRHGYITRVAAAGDQIDGYIIAIQLAGEGQLLDIAVHPGQRHRGIGGALMEELLRIMMEQGCRVLYLEVRASNTPAIRLYEKIGFTTISTRKGYYKNPVEDALIMKLEIK
jgi:ribosomal-protein-alanine N-acetyltransferase